MEQARRPLLRVFAGALLIQAVLGSFFSWGSFTVHITSYLRAEDPSVTYEKSAWVNAAAGLGPVLAYGAGSLHSRIGVRCTALIGGAVLAGGVASSAATIRMGLLPFVATYGGGLGAGMGILYSAPVKCVMDWVPERKGLATSFVFAGVGLGTLLFNYLELWLVNPNNIQLVSEPGGGDVYLEDREVLDRVPPALLTLGVVYALMLGLGSALLIEKPVVGVAGGGGAGAALLPKEGHLLPSEVLRTSSFWLIWSCYCLNMMAASFAMVFVKVFGQNVVLGMSDSQLTTVASASALANAGGRLLFGTLMDVLPHRQVLAIMSGTMAIFTASLQLCAYGGFFMYLVWNLVIFACVGGICSVWAVVSVAYFGATHFGRNFGLVLTAACVAYVGSALFIYCLRATIGDIGDSMFAASCSAAAFLSAVALGPSKLSSDPRI